MKLQGWHSAKPGDVQLAADWVDPVRRRQYVETHPGDHVVRRHPGKIDAGQFAGHAGTAVGADEVLGPQLIGAVRRVDLHHDAGCVLIETGQCVTPTKIHVVFVGPVRKRLNKLGLLNGQQKRLRVGHQRKIQCEGGEHRPRIEPRRLRGSRECAVQAAMVQDPNPLADDTVGPPQGIRAGHRLQHHRPDPVQGEFTGQHQPVGAATRNDDVNHLAKLSSWRLNRQTPTQLTTPAFITRR
ncbi:hypothetical protein ATCCBAA256_16330 [Mycobacterium montefiorense]|nr:hypothetical protein ATCCBAA256_16330 [Mycobacterium montefiorense]